METVGEQRRDYESALSHAESTLDQVDRALERLDAGTYATCAACGEPIAEERLVTQPTTEDCGGHLALPDRPG